MDQSAGDLWATVSDKYIEIKNLIILEQQTRSYNTFGLKVTAGILGSSHFVRMEHGQQQLTEILSCIKLPNPDLIYHQQLNWPICEISINVQGRIYSSICNTYSLGETKGLSEMVEHMETFQEKYLAAKEQPSAIAMSRVFPGDTSTFEPQTILVVTVDESTKTLHISSLHSYPNEGNLVITHSQLNSLGGE